MVLSDVSADIEYAKLAKPAIFVVRAVRLLATVTLSASDTEKYSQYNLECVLDWLY